MSAAGAIRLDVAWDGRRISALKLTSTRVPVAERLLVGRTPAETPRLVGMLFSVCRRAQMVACDWALDAARGTVASGAQRLEAERAVVVEALHENLWRLLLDWPGIEGEAAEPARYAALRRGLANIPLDQADALAELARRVSELLQQQVFGTAPAIWLGEIDGGGVDDWIGAGATQAARLLARLRAADVGGVTARLLPQLDASTLSGVLAPQLAANPEFLRLPVWHGVPAETGPLARHAGMAGLTGLRQRVGDTVGLRLVARLVDAAHGALRLAELAEGASSGAVARSARLGAGEGCAAVETARGTLVHRVVVENERVAAYQVLAPTEWNFHPDGALADLLQGQRAADAAEAERAARLAVHALDPCVPHTVRVIRHA